MSSPPAPVPPGSWLEWPDGRTFALTGACAIGRQPDNDLVLDLPTLSRRHALLAAEAEGFTLSDLHSRNGTFVNGAAITRPVTLRDGDEVRFGDAALRFRCSRADTAAPRPIDAAATQRLGQVRERMCWLLLLDVAGFAALNENLGSEAAHHRMQAWIAAVRPLIEEHAGHINGYLGDAIFAYWLADTATPDQVLATLAAIETWRPSSPLVFRVVAHHGRVLFTHSDRGEELTGQDVNILFRSEKLAKAFNTSAILTAAAARTLGLIARAPALGQSAIDGMTGKFLFYGLPVEFSAPSL